MFLRTKVPSHGVGAIHAKNSSEIQLEEKRGVLPGKPKPSLLFQTESPTAFSHY